MTGSTGDELKAALPPALQARVTALRFAEGAATVVADVSGLDAIERERTEAALRVALLGQPGVSEVRVAMTADKVQRRIIAVGSGKGGVGKSTLSANLAVAMSRLGRKVGLVDADIYGPSQPRLLQTEGIKPRAKDSKMFPVPSPFGFGVLSMGNLIEGDKAIAWRGPMASGALGQLIDADWGDAEILIVDLPPGTGDVQLTMLQRHKPAGAVIVSTPQDLALIDATRAMQLFNQAGVPIIGVVENMAGYMCPHCGEVSDPFGSGGAEAEAARLGEAFLGRIPLTIKIRQDSDAGQPPAAGDSPEGQAFAAIARRVLTWLDNQ
ncbi:Mrp/NBP35 family ATP-binding protein [Novosphingobium sp.]|uniref:Mrp/NBP35 family ATP-binding protein n=1 Tax=Novosphingobium sp. TaxID=1874826 RepID=UPI00286E8AC9|nr:Mrp/NBP35 family ATP-binding protein [Novosphingobium sp.]